MKTTLFGGLLLLALAAPSAAQTPAFRGDADGDGKADMVFYRAATGDWPVLKSSTGFVSSTTVNWGGGDYTAVPGDYDGDGRMDYALYQPFSGVWLILKSGANYTTK